MSDSIEKELWKKRTRLLEGIVAGTANGKITWDDTSEKDTFVAQAGSSAIQVIDETLKAGNEPAEHYGICYISIFNSTGGTVDSFFIHIGHHDTPSDLETSTIALRRAINGSMAKLTSKRLDSVLEEIGA